MIRDERGQPKGPDNQWLLEEATRIVDAAWREKFGNDVEPELPIEDPVRFIMAAIEEITHIVNNNVQLSGAINFSTITLATNTDKSKGFSVSILGRSQGTKETFELVRNGLPKVPQMEKNHDAYLTFSRSGICYLLVDTERFPQATQFESLQQAEGVIIRSGGRISVNAPLTAFRPNTLGFLASVMQEAVTEFRRLPL